MDRQIKAPFRQMGTRATGARRPSLRSAVRFGDESCRPGGSHRGRKAGPSAVSLVDVQRGEDGELAFDAKIIAPSRRRRSISTVPRVYLAPIAHIGYLPHFAVAWQEGPDDRDV
jgi:hypothetical protein